MTPAQLPSRPARSTSAPSSVTALPTPSRVVSVMRRISPAFMPSPAAMDRRTRRAFPPRPFTTCGVDMTADSENDTIPKSATALFIP